jgi:hypothetical protein
MGWTTTLVAVSRDPGSLEGGIVDEGVQSDRWTMWEAQFLTGEELVEELRLVKPTRAPAFITSIEDSDWAIFAFRHSTTIASAVLNPDRASESVAGRSAMSLAAVPGDLPQLISRWATESGVDLTASDIGRLLFRDWDVADDAIAAILRLLGAPFADGLPPELSDTSTSPSRGPVEELGFSSLSVPGIGNVAGSNDRYYVGMGSDYVGVWDRQRSERPLATFPKTREGIALALREFARLTAR